MYIFPKHVIINIMASNSFEDLKTYFLVRYSLDKKY